MAERARRALRMASSTGAGSPWLVHVIILENASAKSNVAASNIQRRVICEESPSENGDSDDETYSWPEKPSRYAVS